MICANSKCKSTEIKKDFIKITKSGEKTKYFCSQKCYQEHYGIEYKWIWGRGFQQVHSKKAKGE